MGLYVYIVLCSDNSYYTGVTNDVDKRVYVHNLGIDPLAYTYMRRPVVLKWHNFFQRNLEAISWEKRIKGWTRKKKEALIEGRFDLLQDLAKCRNETRARRRKK